MSIQWTKKEAVHLLSRAGFGASQADVAASVSLGREETVGRLIAGVPFVEGAQAPLAFDQFKTDGAKALDPQQIADQQLYWLYRMVATPAPLIEKMTLFWHGHFATANYKVKDAALMAQQNELFRKYALGNFKELVNAIGQDPAMMIWLDANKNKKGKPNENYAREAMELFTLGIGHYTETDVKEAARAFTGWTYNKETHEVAFNAKQHDGDIKTLLGESGKLDAVDAVDILFHQKALPVFMATKLLNFFATDTPSESWVQKVAADFAAKPTVGDVLRELFLADEFYDEKLRLALIKTPADYVAGTLRMTGVAPAKGHAQAMRRMGQELFVPPDVAGWRGGQAWLTSNNLLARFQFAEGIAKSIGSAKLTSADWKPQAPVQAAAWVQLWAERLGIATLSEKTQASLSSYANDSLVHSKKMNTTGLRGLLQLVLISPEAQMK
ncbi:DUF1800 domain-containing protein [Paenibacillus whitsoniae]|uniref:DUF1800 domain-containing protein n=1 Tax=Paenibacillus whitsoniae TaxID=2496558 RepID=A0A3S0A1G9_9BACL|nr:DUF1800 domain-containing protein [Paenibacillus whitsoniae]RTE06332.1 DUF1800 domain-containing protein [Paenibacillus whitsoniae]